MTDKPKSAEAAGLERWFANAADNDEDWGGELSWLRLKWALTASALREYKLILREQERQAVIAPTATTEHGRNPSADDETILRGVIFCCAALLLGCVVAAIIFKLYI